MIEPISAERILALSVQQPWASIIVHLDHCFHVPKRVENRNWKPVCKVPFWMAIHAGLTLDTGPLEHLAPLWAKLGNPRNLPRGVIIGLARVDRVASEREARRLWPEQEPWICGEYCWHFDRVVALQKAIPCKGALGLWDVKAKVGESDYAELVTTWNAAVAA